ncbi:HEAT repeat domain-containing protein [Thermospira aquatica]|uniref:HEAT repeat domain-containing protein n=1 Tax=Thermospira aquatica TaxID=2828656 RepID=A0AAX3BCG9_9SPIR|nr:HEAT repeat domain-containing protein [Thermospira aquatica]URA09938.1 HEAT repeat domain-containing protein [Thermospira aquatica]
MKGRWLLFVGILFFSFVFAVDAKIIEQWQKTMQYGISSQRIGVIKAIKDSKAVEGYDLIMKALASDDNPNVRGEAAYALVELKLSNQEPWIQALQKETNSEVLRRIAFGCSELKVKAAAPLLFSHMTNRLEDTKESLLVATILRALGELEYKPAEATVLGILSNYQYTKEVRGAAAVAIGSIGGSKSVALLKTLINDPAEVKEVRMYGAYALGKTKAPEAFDILTPIIDNEKEDVNVRVWGLAGLAFLSGPQVGEKVIQYTRSDNILLRTEAIKTLAKIKETRAIEILKYKALYDPEVSVRKEAKNALQTLGFDLNQLTNTTQTNTQTNTATTNR